MQIQTRSVDNPENKKDFSRRRFVLSGGLAATAVALFQDQTQAETSFENDGKLQEPLDGIYNIKNFGAKGDGKTLDSPAINKAIELCSSNGGGTVLIHIWCLSVRDNSSQK